jgi:F-type H+-transporting ATPase subunit gamma
MSGRLSDIHSRINATRQLEAVITAMRAVAAARAREAQSRLAGVRAYSEALGEAIGAAMALAPDETAAPSPAADGHIVLAFVAEQGFAGAFSERALAAARAAIGRSRGETALLLIGARGAALAAEQGLEAAWSAPMVSHVEEAPALADRIAGALYERLGENQAARVTLIHAAPLAIAGARVVGRPLIPLDLARFPASRGGVPPLTNLPSRELIAGLAREYVFAELCEAVVLSFAAENEARMQAMIAARANVRDRLDELTASHRRLRQEEITEEIIELAAR